MQKVEGSSPFIRSKKAPQTRGFHFQGAAVGHGARVHRSGVCAHSCPISAAHEPVECLPVIVLGAITFANETSLRRLRRANRGRASRLWFSVSPFSTRPSARRGSVIPSLGLLVAPAASLEDPSTAAAPALPGGNHMYGLSLVVSLESLQAPHGHSRQPNKATRRPAEREASRSQSRSSTRYFFLRARRAQQAL